MKKKIIMAMVLIAITAGGIYQYMRINTYSYHLDKAKVALTKIEELTKGKSLSSKFIIPIAHAEGGQIDEAAVAENAKIAVDEIGEAQNIVNDMTDSAERTNAQNEIEDTKEQAEETLGAAAEAVEGENAKESMFDSQESLDNIESGKEYTADNARDASNENHNNDGDMAADQAENENQFGEDNDEGEGKEEGEENNNIDEADRLDEDENDKNNDTADYDAAYKAAEEKAMERYRPYLDWKGATPVPLEGQQKGNDTASDGTPAGEAPDAEAIQDAIDNLRTEGEEEAPAEGETTTE